MSICSIEWCRNKWYTYCTKHYVRYKKYGDPLIVTKMYWENRINNKLYQTYISMKNRCYNNRYAKYHRYWWRWIRVCDRWLWIHWFTNFCNDMWERPEKHTLDRIDNNWDYEPSNCRRATIYQQSANKSTNNKFVWVSLFKKNNKRRAYISVNNRFISLWYYDKFNDAVEARRVAEWELYNTCNND